MPRSAPTAFHPDLRAGSCPGRRSRTTGRARRSRASSTSPSPRCATGSHRSTPAPPRSRTPTPRCAACTRAEELGVDTTRIAVAGASAGGGIAAALAQLAHDRGEVPVAFQLLVYPMLDDRTVTRADHDTRGVRVWTPRSNRFGWASYLGRPPGGDEVAEYLVPARRRDLSGLPSAWIGVGDLDLFHDEDLSYAERLRAAGVPCEVQVVPGAFHGFDALFRGKPVSHEFLRTQVAVLRQALHG